MAQYKYGKQTGGGKNKKNKKKKAKNSDKEEEVDIENNAKSSEVKDAANDEKNTHKCIRLSNCDPC